MPPKKKIVGLKIKDLLDEEKRENSGTENGHEDGYDSLLLVRVTDSMLTKSELAVLYLLAKGLQHKEIAYKYNLSINTVKCHKANIYRKLNVVNLIEAIITYNKYIRSLSDPIL
jgi:DNA-binding NarL/FixJ family response regulator